MDDTKNDKASESMEKEESLFEFIKGDFMDPSEDSTYAVIGDDPEGEVLYGYSEELDENQIFAGFLLPEDDEKEP